MTTSGKLVLVRHGESEWNATGQWTGWTDIPLSENGKQQAAEMGNKLTDIHFDYGFTSDLTRAIQTLRGILATQGQADLPFTSDPAIKERDYGDYTSMNKWQVKEKVGEEQFNNIRRGWDCPVPGGETLKDVYERSVPYYLKEIVQRVIKGQNILVAAHGNSIRALIKYIENLSDNQIEHTEMILGKALIYTLDESGRMTSREERNIDTAPTKA
jgi:2,3-bisphosphoglycerate-dependent phosphoglycerate mutase